MMKGKKKVDEDCEGRHEKKRVTTRINKKKTRVQHGCKKQLKPASRV